MQPQARADLFNRAMTARPGDLDRTIGTSLIAGSVPPALRGGRLFSNGPGWTKIGDRLAHPFDGHGYVRAFTFGDDGGVKVRGRFVQTPVYQDEAREQRLIHRGLGTNISDRFWQNLGMGAPRNVANTTVVRWGDALLAGWEGGAPYALDPDTLATRGEQTFGGAIAGEATLAHMRHDVARGRLVLCSVGMGKDTTLTFREVDRAGAVVATTRVEVPGSMFAHDFVITPSWYVLVHNPLRFKPWDLVRALTGASTLINAIATRDDAPGEVLLIPRQLPGPMRRVTLPKSAFVVHYGAAFERDGDVIFDASLFHSFRFGEEFGFRGPRLPLDPGLPDGRDPQRLYRVTVPAGASAATWTQLAPHGIDFLRVHPEHDGVDTPILVGASRADLAHSDPFDSVLQLDLHDPGRPAQLWTAPRGGFVGEPVLAPVEGTAGFVLVLVTDDDGTQLAIFAADAVDRGPVAQVPLGLMLPYGFHGAWEGRADF